MAGFLNPKERVADMVLTDVGKGLLLKGDLHFVYWIPFDDEVDYDPPVASSSLVPLGSIMATASALAPQDLKAYKIQLTEAPLVREASMGYRGLNFREEDTTNVNRPMYTAPPGVGQTYPLLSASVSTGSLEVVAFQQKQSRLYVQRDPSGHVIAASSGPSGVAFRRQAQSEAQLAAEYPLSRNDLSNMQLEGFLVTMYHSSSIKTDELGQEVGGFEEVLQNRDSKNDIVYRNDLALDNFTP